MANPQRLCIFCDGPGLTKEHIWSKWTYALVPRGPSTFHYQFLTETSVHESPMSKRLVKEKRVAGTVNTTKPKVVCRTCNNGWMSTLETAVQPILTPLIRGEGILLDAAKQRILATWITMKLMVLEFSDQGNLSTPRVQRTFFYREKHPPDRWQIWLAKHDTERWTNAFVRHSVTLNLPETEGVPVSENSHRPKNAQWLTLGIGKLVIEAFATEVAHFEFRLNAETKSTFRPIWPFTGDVLWPPIFTLDDKGMDYVIEEFDTLLAALRPDSGTG